MKRKIASIFILILSIMCCLSITACSKSSDPGSGNPGGEGDGGTSGGAESIGQVEQSYWEEKLSFNLSDVESYTIRLERIPTTDDADAEGEDGSAVYYQDFLFEVDVTNERMNEKYCSKGLLYGYERYEEYWVKYEDVFYGADLEFCTGDDDYSDIIAAKYAYEMDCNFNVFQEQMLSSLRNELGVSKDSMNSFTYDEQTKSYKSGSIEIQFMDNGDVIYKEGKQNYDKKIVLSKINNTVVVVPGVVYYEIQALEN